MNPHQNLGGKQKTEELQRQEQSQELCEEDAEHDNKDAEEVAKEMINDEKEDVKLKHEGQAARQEDEVKQQDEGVVQQVRELDLGEKSVKQKVRNTQQQEEEMRHEEVGREEVRHEEIRHEEVVHEEVRHEEVVHEEVRHEKAKHMKILVQQDEEDEQQVRDILEEHHHHHHQLQTDQVEEEQVRMALREDQGRESVLGSWSTESFTEKGDHYLSAIRRLTISFTLAGHTHHTRYIVKANQSSFGCLSDLIKLSFQKECLIYGTLFPAFNTELGTGHLEPLRVPRCYLQSLKQGREVLILEDLSRNGFKMVSSRLIGLDASHGRLVVQELGRLHASSFLYQATLPSHSLAVEHPLLQRDWYNYSEVAEAEMGAILKSDLEFLAAVAEGEGRPKDEVAWLRDLATRTLQVFNHQLATETPFAVLCHGDCWTNNFLFRYDSEGVPVDVRMLDLQLCRKGSVALDLTTLMYTSLSGQERRACLASLLQEYHASFSHVMQARGAPVPFSLDQLVAEYRKKSLFGLLMGADYLPVVMVEPDDAPDFSLVNAGEDVFARDRLDKLPGILQRNPNLVTLILDLLDDMADLGVLEDDQTTRV